jgi:hypothetical protein
VQPNFRDTALANEQTEPEDIERSVVELVGVVVDAFKLTSVPFFSPAPWY